MKEDTEYSKYKWPSDFFLIKKNNRLDCFCKDKFNKTIFFNLPQTYRNVNIGTAITQLLWMLLTMFSTYWLLLYISIDMVWQHTIKVWQPFIATWDLLVVNMYINLIKYHNLIKLIYDRVRRLGLCNCKYNKYIYW